MSALAPSIITQRDPKGTKFMGIVGAAYDKARLTEEEGQRVNDTPGLAALIDAFIAENRSANKYKNEEVKSSFTYPKEYKGPKPIDVQIKALAKILDLDPTSALEYIYTVPAFNTFVPADALKWTAWFAVPSVDAIARKHFPDVTDEAERHCRALQLQFEKIAATRPFTNWREGEIDPEHLRLSDRTKEALAAIAKTQQGDILVIAAQLGMRHRGCSTRRAREKFVANEFGLDSVMGTAIALTHPERFVRYDELDMDLPGDEWKWTGDSGFSGAPILHVDGEGLKFVTNGVAVASDSYGSASGFVPQ